MTQIDVIAAETSFSDDRRDSGSHVPGAFDRRIDDHTREPRRQRKRTQLAALFRNAPGSIDSAKLGKKLRGFAERGTRWRIEKRKLCRVAYTPLRQVEHARRQVSRKYFRAYIGMKQRGQQLFTQHTA